MYISRYHPHTIHTIGNTVIESWCRKHANQYADFYDYFFRVIVGGKKGRVRNYKTNEKIFNRRLSLETEMAKIDNLGQEEIIVRDDEEVFRGKVER